MDLFPDLPGFDIEKSRDTKFATSVQTAASGKELRATFQSGTPRFEYALKLNFARRAKFSALTPQDEILALLKCYNSARGKLNPLLLVDPVNGTLNSSPCAAASGLSDTCQFLDDERLPAQNILPVPVIKIPGFVPATAIPWGFDAGKNSTYQYSSPWTGTPPVCVPVTAGAQLNLTAYGTGSETPIGVLKGPDGGALVSDGTLPSEFAGHAHGTNDLMGLMGAFADASGNVIKPVWIGSAASLVVPAGATVLQLGANDAGGAWDNRGGFFVFNNGIPTHTWTTESLTGWSLPFTYSATDGTLKFFSNIPAGVVVSVSGKFARKVRFSDDSLSIKQIVEKLFSGDSIKLVSLK